MKLPRRRPELLLAAAALLICAGVLVVASAGGGQASPAAQPPTAVLSVVNPFEHGEQAAQAGGSEPAGSYAVGYTGVILYPPVDAPSAKAPTQTGNTPTNNAPPARNAGQPTNSSQQFTNPSQPAIGFTEPPMEYAQPPAALSTQPAQPPQIFEQTASAAPHTTAAPQVPLVVNINTADQAQLETLPGIGPVKAQAILDWRAAHGRFTDAAQLLEVKGIGEKTLEKLLPYVVL